MELYLIVEFCEFGNLEDFLGKYKDTFTNLLDDRDQIIHSSQKLSSNYKYKVPYDDATNEGNNLSIYDPII